ncbi:MAG TPA: hypothetical protein VFB77_16460 [Acidimicrobiales bacterium]|nr:hypothetical protein [Acidimicrobiales bacterium]
MTGIDRDASGWPEAGLDAIGRLRVIEAAVPAAAASETVIDAPFDRVWAYVTDMERSIAEFDSLVGRVRIRQREPAPGGAEDLVLQAWAPGSPVALVFDVRLEPGLCLMRARGRLFLVGMAAVAEGDRTRFRHAEGVPLPGGRLLRPVVRRTSRADSRRIARLVEGQT